MNEVVKGSRNVYEDLGLPNAKNMQAKVGLTSPIGEVINLNKEHIDFCLRLNRWRAKLVESAQQQMSAGSKYFLPTMVGETFIKVSTIQLV